jgi:hypothetical protein
MSIKEEIEKQRRAKELSREQKTLETKEQLVPLSPRRKELLDHLRQATEGLQVLFDRMRRTAPSTYNRRPLRNQLNLSKSRFTPIITA